MKNLYGFAVVSARISTTLLPSLSSSTNFEGGEDQIPVLFVNKHGELVVSYIEGAIRVVFVKEGVDHGVAAEGHVGLHVQLELITIADGGPLALVSPHAHAILLSFNISQFTRNDLGSELQIDVADLNLGFQLAVLELDLHLSLRGAAHRRPFELGGESLVGEVNLVLSADLQQLLASLVELNLHLVGAVVVDTLDESFEGSGGSGAGRLEFKVSVGLSQIEILHAQVQLEFLVAAHQLKIDALARNPDNMENDVPVPGGVDVLGVQLGHPVRLQLNLSVGDHSRDDGGAAS